MPYQEVFAVENYMDEHETDFDYNLGEVCCHSMSLDEVCELTGERFSLDQSARLAYGEIKGSSRLRSIIASMYSNEDYHFTEDNVVLTNGAIGANFLVNYTLIGPGDHVICVDPTYQQLQSVPKMFGAEIDLLKLQEHDGFLPNLDEVKAIIKPNTKLIVINNPNNPLGCTIPTKLLQELAKLAEAHDIHVLCDEVYAPLFHSCAAPKSFCNLYAKGIITGSMSKAFSAAGLRIGWIVTQDRQFLNDALSRRDYNIISISMVDDSIAQYILSHREKILSRNMNLCKKNLTILKQFIEASRGKFSFYSEPTAGSVCLVKVHNIKNTFDFCTKLVEHYRVLCVPGETFGIPGTMRIGYANSSEDLLKGLPILEKAYDDWLALQKPATQHL